MCAKKALVFGAVFLLVCSSVWAIPGVKKTTTVPAPVQEAVEVVEEVPQVTVETTTTESSENDQSEMYVTYEALQKIFEKNWLLGGEKLDSVQNGVDSIWMYAVQTEANTRELNNEIDNLRAEVKNLNNELQKEKTGTKYFMDMGVAFGFNQPNTVSYGGVFDCGIKLGKGLLIKTGMQMMLGDLGKVSMPSVSLDGLTVNCSVGWQW